MAPSVGDALLDQLADQGVAVCFGVPGVHNLPFWVGAGAGRRPRVVGVRHEQAAGYAADASARATGGLGVALTTTGPGFANALAAFGEAYASFSPVLLISSETPVGPRRRSGADDGLLHGMRSQADVIRHGFGARAVSARDGAEALAALPELAAHALATGRPAYLGVPADVLASPWPAAGPRPVTASRPAPPITVVATAAAALRGRRVAIWLGARAVPAQSDVRRRADLLGAMVVPTYQARGMLADHPGTITAPPHEPSVAEAVAACDVLLVVGDDLHGMTTSNWRMRLPPVVIAITDDADASLGDYALDARIEGDVATSVRLLLGALGDERPTDAYTDGAALSAAVLAGVAADPRTAAAARFVATIDKGWPQSGALVLDMCVAGYWLGGYSRQTRVRRMHYPVGWGTLGFGLPAAIGPAAHGIPTLAVVGDGGAAMALGELATYAQEQLPIAFLVVADGGYGMLRYDQTVAGDPHRGVELVEPRWEDLAAAYGMRALRTDDPGAGLERALAGALDGLARGERWMVVLEAAFLPPRTTSPRWRET
jgi:thiamine pyrophosphate-dependent acetolactate synthase large subunit-like protein